MRREERERREAAVRAAAKRRARRRRVALVAGAIVAIAAVVGAIAGGVEVGGSGTSPDGELGSIEPAALPDQRLTGLRSAAKAAGCELQDPPEKPAQHVEGRVDYESAPPTSGPHALAPARDGVYTEPPLPEKLVHPLEHGNIVIWFDPELSDAERGGLAALYNEDAVQMILTPNPRGMPYAVAASAWGHLVGCPRFNPRVFDALRAFRDRYRGKGPEAVS